MRTLQEIEQQFPGAADKGLSAEAVADSTRRYGLNRLTPLPREPMWKKFLGKFDEPIIKILLAAALLSMFVDLFQVRPDVAGIALGVVAVVIVGLGLLRRMEWVPSVLFGSAVVVFVVALSV